jgi:PKD domain
MLCLSGFGLALVMLPSDAGAAEWFFGEGDFSEGAQPRVAMNAAGEVVVVSRASEGFGSRIRVSLRPPDGSFSRVAVSGEGLSAEAPEVAIDPAGDVIAVWQEGESGQTRIYESYRPAGGSFGAPAPISSAGATAPAVAMDSRGEATVVWLLDDETNEIVQAATSSRGGSFSAPVALSGDGGNASSVGVTMDASGDAVASWTRTVSDVTQLEDALSRHGGGFPAPDEHGDGSIIGESDPGSSQVQIEPPAQHVVLNGLGEALAVWRTSGGEVRVARLGAGSSSFGVPVTLGTSPARPSLAMNEEGEAVVGWPVAMGMDLATAPAGGSFGPLESVPSVNGGTPEQSEVTIAPGGTAAAAWLMGKEGTTSSEFNEVAEEATVRPPGGVFEPVAHQQSYADRLTAGTNSLELASDGVGDVFGIWQEGTDLSDRVESMLYDRGPVLGQVTAPTGGQVGQSLSFGTTAPASVWAPLESVTWDFGDGTSASGLSTTHTYTQPGVYQVILKATSTQNGGFASRENVGTTVTHTVTITAPPITSPPGRLPSGLAAPDITNAHESHRSWREGSHLAHFSRSGGQPPTGTTFSFTLNELAKVSLNFTHLVGGRESASGCVAPSKKNHSHAACKRTTTLGTLSFAAHAGINRLTFAGHLSRHVDLRPGRYQLVITAANAVGERSDPATLSFSIVR